jgi:hypothetical protein
MVLSAETASRQHSNAARSSIARHQESPYSEGSIVFADSLKIAVHYGIVARAGRQVSKPERVEVERRVNNILQSQDVGRFAKNAGLARSHRTGNDKQ